MTVATLRVEFRRFEELVVSLGTPAAAERCSGGDAEAEAEAARAMACVERLVPQLMGLIKAVGAVPIDFAAEAPVKAAAVRMPAELL